MFRYGFRKHISDLGVDYADKVLVAVSGGVDSMCLLDALVHCQMDLDISVAHVNFNLRGEESDADTAMVVKWCGENNIPLHTVSFETKEYASENGISVEMAARELRYNWFFELMQQNGYKFLAIAHNANDNAETLLLNLTRGCGIEGIGGIQEKVLLEFADQDAAADTQQTADTGSSADTPQAADTGAAAETLPATDQDAAAETGAAADTEFAAKEDAAHCSCGQQFIIRPLLCYSRQQIEKYALKFKVPFRTDSTNLLSDYSRNRIRNEVFPQLAKINPSVITTFNNNIKHFRQAGNIMQRHIEEKCAQLCHRFGYFQDLLESRFSHNFCGLNLRLNCVEAEEEKYSMIVCIVETAQLLEEAEWEFWVYQIAYPYGFSPAIIENICNALSTEDGPKKFLSGNGEIIAVKERGLLKFCLNIASPQPLKIDTTSIPRESWRTRKDRSEELCPTLYMDAAKVQMPLECRPVAPGDRFSPIGLRGSKKVTDYLSDIKFEHLHKGNVMVLCDATGKIICIPGLQIAGSVKVTTTTSQILQIRVL